MPAPDRDDDSTTNYADVAAESEDAFGLLVAAGRDFTRTCPLNDPSTILVGRDSAAQLRLPDRSVSRRHAVIHVANGTVAVEDLASANGSRVGDTRLEPGARVELHAGDVVEFGAITVVVYLRQSTGSYPRAAPPDGDAAASTRGDSGVIVIDDAMRRLHEIVERVAPSAISVLLFGETGVGKEIFAERLHRLSERRDRPLLRLNCAALPESLLEAELFGYEKGAFTGATQAKPGLLETASGGTVFLDEIGELPSSLQAKLLRVLEAGEVLPVGGLKPRMVDLRVIAATHRDLEHAMAEEQFRRDLFFRLSGISLTIPPLRERKAEIVPLARAFVSRAAARAGRSPQPTLSAAAEARLEAHTWPGNVRELRNVIERTLLLVAGSAIDADDLQLGRASGASRPALDPELTEPLRKLSPKDVPPLADASLDMRTQRSQLEHTAIVEALARARGNQTRAARMLGIARSTLVKRMELYGLPRPRKDD
jgi:two-component system, NtrC family, response regulator AtoC